MRRQREPPRARRVERPRAEEREPALRQRDPLAAEVPEHRGERPDVQRDVEREAGLFPSERPGRQRDVRRTADGQDLRQPLQGAEDDRLLEGHVTDR